MNYGFMNALNAIRGASTREELHRAIDITERLNLSDYERGAITEAICEVDKRLARCEGSAP
jgi:hypothetical protein